MSKRFGRNQKRKLKESLVEAQFAADTSNKATLSAQKQVRDLQRNIKDIVDTVEAFCRNSAAIEPKQVHTGTNMHDEFTLPLNREMSLYEAISDYNATNFNDVISTVNTYALRAFIKNHEDTFSTRVHIKFGYDNRVSYAISKDALLAMPTDLLVNRVLPDITHEMLTELKRSLK